MKKIAILAAILSLLLSSQLFAQNKTFDPSQYEVKYQKFVLDNGLTLIVHEDRSVPIVGVNMWYHVGSRNEQRGKTGFAHLFEHFFFNGSENHPSGFREAMDDIGANNRNGTTNTDRTNFFEDVPVSALERTLFLEADRMGFLRNYISEEMLERERGVVKNEKRQSENQPYGTVFSNIFGKIYPYSHPYSWSPIGSMEDLNAATLDDIKDWYATYYGPNNAVISLAGDISPARAFELVNKYFGDIKPGPPLPRLERWIPALDRNIRDEMQDRVPQARIYRVYMAPTWREKELQHLGLFADVLTGSKSARLTKRLVYEKELATNVGAFVNDGELSSTMFFIATVKPGVDPAVVEKEMDAVVAETLEKGVTAEELQRAQSRNLSSFLRGAERLGGFGGRSDILAESETYGGSPDFYLKRLEWMANASAADVTGTAKKWLSANSYTMTVKPFDRLSAGKTLVDRSKVPALDKAPEITFPKVQRMQLSNGLNIVLLERHSAPIVNVTLAVDAGYASDSSDKAGLALMALLLLDEGTKSRDAFQIVNQLDLLGARLFTGSSLDQSFVRLQSTAANLKPSLEIMADVVLNPSFPQNQVAIQKQNRIAQIGQEKASPNALAMRVLPAILYGKDHAYGKPSTGTEETVGSLTREDLMKWHSDWFKPGNSTLIVTGDTTMEELLPMVQNAFEKWQKGSSPKKNLATVPNTPGKKVYLLDRPGAQQSTIVSAHISESSGQPEDLAGEPLFRNFGGMSTSRLNRNLRLDKHWSYGTSGQLRDSRGQRTFMVLAPVQTDKTKEAMLEVKKEIEGVAGSRPVTGEEFESIMRNMTLRLPGRFETLSSLESAAIDLVNFGLPDDYWSNYGSRMRELKETDLLNAGKKFVRPNEVIWIIVGDLEKIEKGVRDLNFGEVIKLDSDGNVLR